MDPINIPELDPSSRIGDARPDQSGEERGSRRKKTRTRTPVTDTPPDPDDQTHQLDELA